MDSTSVQPFSSRHFVSGLKDDAEVGDAYEKRIIAHEVHSYLDAYVISLAFIFDKITMKRFIYSIQSVKQPALSKIGRSMGVKQDQMSESIF